MGQILAAGHCNWDVTLRVEALPDPDGEARITEQHRAGGGSAANVASALAGLDLPAGLIGSVGADAHGRMAVEELEAQGVDISRVLAVDTGETTVKYLVVDAAGEVMVLANDGVNEAVGPDDVDAGMLEGASHLHLTSQRPETAARLIDLAETADISVSFDPGRRVEDRAYEGLLDRVDVLLLNEREAGAVLPGADVNLDPGEGRAVVVKRGADGASVYAPDGTVHHPGFAVEAVDTTGAGDAFAAGFLAATVGGLAPGFDGSIDEAEPDYERVLAVANACGALAVKHAGARSAPGLEGLSTFLAERAD
jgi:ribokinase